MFLRRRNPVSSFCRQKMCAIKIMVILANVETNFDWRKVTVLLDALGTLGTLGCGEDLQLAELQAQANFEEANA